MSKIVAYTDGAYSSARDQGGIGLVLLKDGQVMQEYSKMYKHTTNNQMELGAIIIVLRAIKGSIESLTIYTDSMYCVGCGTLGWKRKKNKPMWAEFDRQMERVKALCPDIKIEHVKGHDGDKYNELCDKLAVKASQQITT